MIIKRLFMLLISLGFLLQVCAAAETEPQPTSTPVSRATQIQPTHAATSAPVLAETRTPAPPTETATATLELTPSPIPTYAILRGVVIPDKVSCRYGPGAMYLYLYGMVKGATQDVIGRTDTGSWVLTRSRGDNKSCWVKTEFLNLNGDVMSVEMVYPNQFTIPHTNQTYRAPWDVAAIRTDNQVTISWKSEPLRPGDEESATSVLYVVETWLCQNGELVFTPLGAYQAQVTVTDEAGCAQPSHGRVYFSEKHGYAGPSEIPWPPAP